jgi:hypothetical protein
MSYSDPFSRMTLVAAANAAVSTTADIFQFVSPAGKKGRIIAMSLVTKVATTGAAGALQIGIPGNTDLYGSIAVPVTVIDTKIPVTAAQLAAIADLPADTVITLDGDGGCDAGSLDIMIDISWF